MGAKAKQHRRKERNGYGGVYTKRYNEEAPAYA